ncbi:MFS transporter [Alkalihalophilus marmarensis]|jgi:YNFM family putative membrane transporter|uniref:Major facilitator superfamily (MFS) profile domain-containing protein n=1 Tax=Alkalihalophilus marmarensis DSM 21297 TaxID=1188261 RepID=U6SHV4_9BACI|nr:MFS transporter [Alkalihalophilus marmarensis]ERN51309.1 hypothetical protein A33I_20735 [Alkalihalophilus marmarensis DSM 21297]MCM3491601.1 MFS transporter [Alkalihalophilus marmarensis]
MEQYIQRGTTDFKKTNLAFFAGGFCTFAILWGMQPILPQIAEEFNVSPAMSSLTQSGTTISLAVSLLIAGSLSEVFGRKSIMAISLVLSAILSIAIGFVQSFELLIFLRVIQGITLAGLPAVAMAYLGEEIEPRSLSLAMGLYVSGNSIGGMSGRIIGGVLTDHFNWQVALIGVGIICLLSSLLFMLLLPKQAHFESKPFSTINLARTFICHLGSTSLMKLFMIGFFAAASFVALYNYIGFELIKPPYSLSESVVGFIFIVYLVGTFSSTWMGMLAGRHGLKKVLQLSLIILLAGLWITLTINIWIKILGIAIFTFGFFAAHSIISTWVGQVAVQNKAQAASIYLFAYYIGGSVGGTVSGVFYTNYGWNGVVVIISIFSIVCAYVTITLRKQGLVS